MPLNRTPPAPAEPSQSISHSTTSATFIETSPARYDSAPELRTPVRSTLQYEDPGEVNQLSKRRKFSEIESPTVNDTLRDLFSNFSADQNVRFEKLQTSVAKIEKQNFEISKSLEFLATKYDEAMTKIQTLEENRKIDKKHIVVLEEKVEFLERKSKSSVVEIRNLPKTTAPEDKAENKIMLTKMVKELGSTVNINIGDDDIKDIYRIQSKKSDSTSIIAEFGSVLTKDKMLNAVKDFNRNKSKPDKLNTNLLRLPGPKKPIFVSESLTLKTQKLFYLARDFAKDNDYLYCWTQHGTVYLRKADKMPHIRIYSEKDLKELDKRNPSD